MRKILSFICVFMMVASQCQAAWWVTLSSPVAESGSGGDISFVAATTANEGGSDLTIDVPAGISDGDILIASMVADSAGTVFDTLTGWTLVQSTTTASSSHYLFSKTASSEGASYTFTSGSSIGKAGVISAYRSSSGSISVTDSDTATSGASATLATTAIACAVSGTFVASWSNDGNVLVSSTSPTMDESDEAAYASSCTTATYYDDGQGASTTATVTYDASNEELTGIGICLEIE